MLNEGDNRSDFEKTPVRSELGLLIFTVLGFVACCIGTFQIGVQGFYVLIKFVVFLSGSWSTFRLIQISTRSRHQFPLHAVMVPLLSGIAILYNPFIPLALGRDIWRSIDVTSAGIFLSASIAGFLALMPRYSKFLNLPPGRLDRFLAGALGFSFILGALTSFMLINPYHFEQDSIAPATEARPRPASTLRLLTPRPTTANSPIGRRGVK